MIQLTPPSYIINVQIDYFDDKNLPDSEKYIAWIIADEYKGIVVTASSIGECLKELGISLQAIEQYRKNTQPK